MTNVKRSLGRGLSALIPDEEMELFRQVARESPIVLPLAKNAKTAAKNRQASSSSRFGHKAKLLDTSANEVKESFLEKQEKPTVRNFSNKKSLDTTRLTGKVEELPDKSGKVMQNGIDLETRTIAISDIQANPFQPRRSFNQSELNDLAASLREHGLIQPIVVRPTENSEIPFQLVAGERRWRAAKMADLQSVPAIVRVINDQQSLELALIENVQRHDISAIDAALAYRRLADEFQLSQESIAGRVGKSRSAVANTMRLLDLQPEIRQAIENGALSEGHGRAILLAQGDGSRRALFRRVTRDQLSVRDTERLARDIIEKLESSDGQVKGAKARRTIKDAIASEFEESAEKLQKKLGARLYLQSRARGGKVVIEYSSNDDLKRLFDLMMK